MKLRFVVERFEGPWAILETIDGETFEFPRAFLPPDCLEGAWLSFEIRRDITAENAAREEMRNLRESLKNQKSDPILPGTLSSSDPDHRIPEE